MPKAASKPAARRPRRSTGEIVERLMEAAVEEFEQKGYTGATTAGIARRADVAEALLFNHFGSKAQLFKATVFTPLSQLFDSFIDDQAEVLRDPARLREDTAEYLAAIQNLIASHPRLFLSLVFAESYKIDEIDGLAEVNGMHDYFEKSAAWAARNFKSEPPIDPELMARISFTTILSCIVFNDWLFPEGKWSPDQVRDAISGFVMEGLSANRSARKP